MKISCIILSKNEEKNIVRAINSVKFCDEIIIVDDYSTDKTIGKCQITNDKCQIFKKHLNGNFSGQRNYAISLVRNDWVLFLDADEKISNELKDEIKSLRNNEFDSYYIKRRDYWWGRELRYGETSKARNLGIIRLIKKDSGRWFGKVHEEYKTTSKVGQLNNFINHYPHPTIKDFLKEVNFYSSLRAKELQTNGNKNNILGIIFYPFGKFILTYFIKLGFLDGPPGFAYAFFMSFHSFLVRSKLYQFSKLENR